MAKDFDVFNVSGIKYKVTYKQRVSKISNFKFRIFKSKLSLPIKACSFAILNSAILSNLMSNSPMLVPQSFFPHTICTLMVVHVDTSYGT